MKTTNLIAMASNLIAWNSMEWPAGVVRFQRNVVSSSVLPTSQVSSVFLFDTEQVPGLEIALRWGTSKEVQEKLGKHIGFGVICRVSGDMFVLSLSGWHDF